MIIHFSRSLTGIQHVYIECSSSFENSNLHFPSSSRRNMTQVLKAKKPVPKICSTQCSAAGNHCLRTTVINLPLRDILVYFKLHKVSFHCKRPSRRQLALFTDNTKGNLIKSKAGHFVDTNF